MSIDQNPSGDAQHGMIAPKSGELKCRDDIARLKIQIIGQYLFATGPHGQKNKDILDPDTVSTDTGSPGTLLGPHGNAMQFARADLSTVSMPSKRQTDRARPHHTYWTMGVWNAGGQT